MTLPSDSPPLGMLFWESTSRCNLSCAHCRRLSTSSDGELTTAEAETLLDSLAALGSPVVVFSGGEPLLRDDWPVLAAHARRRGLPTALATNGTLLDRPLARQVAEAGFHRVAVSLDGAEAKTHDALRGEGNFRRALAGLECLRAAGVPVQINMTVTRGNTDQLDALLALAQQCGAAAVHLFLLVPVGCGAALAAEGQLAPPEYLRVLEWVCDRQVPPGLELRATCAPQIVRVAAGRTNPPGRRTGCLAGRNVAFVSHRGEVFPCGYLPVRCGSVRQSPFETIWRTAEVFQALRDPDRRKGLCSRCGWAAVCGGCRARAYAATGDSLAEDISCPFRER